MFASLVFAKTSKQLHAVLNYLILLGFMQFF